MKHVFKIVCFLICLSIFSCKKYEDGPDFSLYTKKSRVANSWKVDKYYFNGEEKTYDYRTLITKEKLEFFKSGKFQYIESSSWSWAVPYYTGSWSFEDKKEELKIVPDNTAVGTRIYKILRLKEKELWVRWEAKPDSVVEYHFVPQTDY